VRRKALHPYSGLLHQTWWLFIDDIAARGRQRMPRVSQLLIAGLTVISAPVSMAECFYPEEVSIPDGAASTYEDMRDSQTFVKEYMAEMDTYLKCLEQESLTQKDLTQKNLTQVNNQPNEGEQPGESNSPYIQKRYAAIDAMESVATRFNEQVRAYKKVNP
jgi:hypothetical protein